MNKIEKMIKELCPNGVEWKKIGEIATLVRGKVISKDYLQDNEGEYPVYSSQTANNGELGRIDTYMFDGKYLTWTTDGAYAGTVFKREGKFNITNVCGLIDIKDEKSISLDYVYYTLAMEAPKYVLEGMGNPKLMSNVMEKVSIPLPPHPIQTEIVRILDKFVEQREQLERLIELRKKQYEYYREEMLTPKEGWVSSKISDFTNVFTGSRVHKDEWKTTGVPFYRSSDVVSYYNGMENNHGKVFISNDLYNKLSAKSGKFHKDDILITGGGTIGIPYLVPNDEPLYVKDADLLCIQKNNSVHHKFLYYFFLTKRFRNYLNLITHNATIAHYTISQIRDTIVDYPSYSEQEEIVSIISDIETSLLALKSALELSKKRYEYYRDEMMRF